MADTVQAGSVVGVFTTDSELRIKVWDNALARFTGVSADNARGKLIQELFTEIETRGLHKKLENVLRDGTVEVLAPAFHRYLIPCPPQTPSTRFDTMLQNDYRPGSRERRDSWCACHYRGRHNPS